MLPLIDPAVAHARTITPAVRVEAEKLYRACCDIGFFTVKNTNLSTEEFVDIFTLAHRFFAQPLEEKMRISIENSSHHRGYGKVGAEQLSPETPADFKETFDMSRDLGPTHPGVRAGDLFYGPNQYPQFEGFKETVERYYQRLSETGLNLLALMAVSLELPIDYFDPLFDDQTSVLRMIHYPPVTDAGQISAGVHTDYGCLTLLAQDAVGGLEVKPRGQDWIRVPYEPDMLVVNIGDLMQRWSNDVFQSTPHRVVPPLGVDRYSIPFFLEPNTKTRVACFDSCVTPKTPCRYEPIFSDDWITSRFNQTYAYRQK
ncbi:2OG-Fe(II) oxygenase [Halothiobacillus neapolitanus c2]|uniref:2-oxoglutarate-dependent ethylene/succinate-forming enzyme n=2 Tax=Halothiobacillus neapolitanus TaxID=927 RepID=D0KZ28_HALNC|nr:2OG-Fe(II) oxygenase [Halothiobacillus neapolitanus c2]TDN66007.1 isopenicillin N synthase-like dioxygenase [Halothiobacillus neapolitanus]